jgi:hypothetical protein
MRTEKEPDPKEEEEAGGVVWCGVVWCGVVWCGVVWCTDVLCGERSVDNEEEESESEGECTAIDSRGGNTVRPA